LFLQGEISMASCGALNAAKRPRSCFHVSDHDWIDSRCNFVTTTDAGRPS
jgi:hypothetical protein